MIPARISRSKKKLYHLPYEDGWYKGYWQDYFCHMEADGKIVYRFDTATKSPKPRGEKVMIRISYPHAFIYEHLNNYNYGKEKR